MISFANKMSTNPSRLVVGDIDVEVVRRAIKNLHLGVYPPHGRVRVAAPPSVSDEAVRLAVVTRMGWIKRQQAKFQNQRRQSRRSFVSGETHYHLGNAYRLRVIKGAGRASVRIAGDRLELRVPRHADTAARGRALERWQRAELRVRLDAGVAEWAVRLGVPQPTAGIKRMKTKWGSCNPDARRIWVNLELVKKPAECLEYLVAHEVIHLVEPTHGDRFLSLLDRHLPQWRSIRDRLNSEPLRHEEW